MLFRSGKNGLRFDLIKINNTFSGAIRNAETYGWTAQNRAQHAEDFAKLTKAAIKEAKAERAATAKVERSASAKSEPAPKAEIDRSMEDVA